MNIKNKILVSFSFLLFPTISLANNDFKKLEYSFPFLSMFENSSFMEEATEYNIARDFPYINEAYSKDIINEKQLIFSISQQEKMYKWMQKNQSNRYIIVNIPSYKIYLLSKINDVQYNINNYFIEWESNVVVGSKYHKTPMTPMKLISLKYNPTWTPTYNIMKRNIRKKDGAFNKEWIEGHNLELYDRKTKEKINYSEAENYSLNDLLLIQPSGDSNALGKIKFETDSTQNIYLHDTNEKWYFEKDDRARSSGCIRVQDPNKLASLLAYNNENYISNNINKGEMYWENVEDVPIYILYDVIEYDKNKIRLLSDPYDIYKEYNEIKSDFYIEET